MFTGEPISEDADWESDTAMKNRMKEKEESHRIAHPEDYEDFANFFDSNGDREIDMKEVSKVLGKGIAKAIEERTARANDEQAEIQSKPQPMDDDLVITTEVETVNENGEKKTVTDQVTEMAGPKEGTLEVLCVRGERLRDTSTRFDKCMDPYVQLQASWV